MMRSVIGALVGIGVALATVLLFDWISHALHPAPEGLDTSDTAALAAHIANAPIAALAVLTSGWIVATFDGVFLACMIGTAKRYVYGVVIGGLMLVATVSNLIFLPHPMWVSITGVAGILLAAWLAVKLAPNPIGLHDE